MSILVLAGGAQASPPSEWKFKDLPTAVAEARASGKPIFLMFGYEDCTWCHYLYKRAMRDEELRSEFQASVVLAYFDTKGGPADEKFNLPDGTSATRADIVKRYAAYPTPSWVFMSPEGAVLRQGRNGKTTPRELREDLRHAIAPR